MLGISKTLVNGIALAIMWSAGAGDPDPLLVGVFEKQKCRSCCMVSGYLAVGSSGSGPKQRSDSRCTKLIAYELAFPRISKNNASISQ